MKTIDRRDFLGRAALGAATASQALAASQPPGASTPAAANFGVGFIGLGRRGFELFETVRRTPAIRISGCCDIVGERMDQARRLVPDTFYIPHFGKLIMSSDVVVIALPDHPPRDALRTALQYGRDVYLEPPATHALEEANQLTEAL